MKHTLRSLMIVVLTLLVGCGRESRVPSKLEQIRQGVENVDKHAQEIEKASQPKPPVEPSP